MESLTLKKEAIFRTIQSVFDHEELEDINISNEDTETVNSTKENTDDVVKEEELTITSKKPIKTNEVEDVLDPVYWTKLFTQHKKEH